MSERCEGHYLYSPMLVVDDGYDTLVQMKNSDRLVSVIRVPDLN